MDRFKAFLMTVIPFGICIIVIFTMPANGTR